MTIDTTLRAYIPATLTVTTAVTVAVGVYRTIAGLDRMVTTAIAEGQAACFSNGYEDRESSFTR